MIILDSSAVIELLKGTDRGRKIEALIEKESIAMSAVTVNEVLIGSEEGQQNEITKNFIRAAHILPVDEDVAYKSVHIEKILIKQGRIIGKLDIFIASMCLIHQLPLITCDKDFKNVDGLKVFLVE